MLIEEELVAFAGAEPTQLGWALDDVASNPNHPLVPSVERALASIDREALEERLTDPRCSHLYGMFESDSERDHQARRDMLGEALSQRVYERRTAALCGEGNARVPPKPYGHPAIEGIGRDEHQLVALADFRAQDQAFIRGGFAFHLTPTLPSTDSSYWLSQELMRASALSLVRVRLDPLMVCSLESYNPALYHMRTYGRPLDWGRLVDLREEEHAEWTTDATVQSDTGYQQTQLCWTPRNDGIHFCCEELPMDAARRPGRYAHAIYDPGTESFVHADGGMRYYTASQLEVRRSQHVRNAGKAGLRVKIFGFDSSLAREAWCKVTAALFVGNADMQSYFDGPRPL